MSPHETTKLFVYGILKKGFALDLTQRGVPFFHTAHLPEASLYRIHSGVGMKLDRDPLREGVYGEIFELENHAHLWDWLDRIEGVAHGVYERKLMFPVTNLGDAQHRDVQAIPCWGYVHTMFPSDWYNEDRLITTGRFG